MSGPFTGRHMAAILVIFFGVVATVNFVMARHAISNFGGTVVDNSYVASQNFDDWRDAQAAQDAKGWDAEATRDEEGRVVVRLVELNSAMIEGRAEHPVRKSFDRDLTFERLPDGRFRSIAPLEEGRWSLRIEAKNDSREEPVARFLIPFGRS